MALTKEDSRIYAYIDIVGTGIETPVIRSDDLTSGYAFTKSNNTKKFSERNTVIFLDSGTLRTLHNIWITIMWTVIELLMFILQIRICHTEYLQ